MRYLLSLLFIFSLNVFATCPLTYWSVSAPSASVCSSAVGKWHHGSSADFNAITESPNVGSVNYFIHTYRNIYSSGQCYYITTGNLGSNPESSCTYDTSDCLCKIPEPQVCSWATTPPWFKTPKSPSTCNNAVKGYDSSLLDETMYLFNHSWCEADLTCYARRYYCPAGQVFDNNARLCVTKPKPAPNGRCPQGYYPTAVKSVTTQSGEQMCGQDWICKTNPADIIYRDFSCGAGPVDDTFPDSNPTAPDPDLVQSAQPYKDGASACSAKQKLAQTMCLSPKVLSFSCDPLTGNVTREDCKDPVTPTTTPPDAGDETKGATTKDIKDLGNNLPTAIKDAIKDFFTDGSMPHLESIRGSLDSALVLDADRNDKLDSISASSDASLALQSDANDHLSGIKSSVDGVKSSVDSMKSSLEGGSGIPASSMISDADILPNGTIGATVEALSDDLGSIQNQFVNAKNLVSGNFTPPTFSGGSCPTLVGPAGISVNPAQIGSMLSPYSPIISILVYISIMFITFGSVFKFLSRGLK